MGKKKQSTARTPKGAAELSVEGLPTEFDGLLAKARSAARTPEEEFVLSFIEISSKGMADFIKTARADTRPMIAKGLRCYLAVLTHGRFYTPSPRPKQFKKGRSGECFANAQRLALEQEGLTYCEGFAQAEGSPVVHPHGWCCTEDGSVVDVTWAAGGAYFGVPFRREFVTTSSLAKEGFSPLLDQMLWSQRPVSDWRCEM